MNNCKQVVKVPSALLDAEHNISCFHYREYRPVPVAARSKALVCDRLPAEIVGSNPTGGCGFLPVVSVVRGLCDELITRPEESYRLWCVVVSDLETS